MKIGSVGHRSSCVPTLRRRNQLAQRRMTALVFVDTNVLVYVLDSTEPGKQRAAAEWLDALWQERAARISWQVLIEFYNNVARKLPDVSASVARLMVETYMTWNPTPPDISVFRRAWEFQD